MMIVISMVLAGVLLGISYNLGPRRKAGSKKFIPYESGIIPIGTTKEKFSAKYYLIAALFILFDVETVFLFAWAVVFKKLGVLAFVEIIIFLVIILGGYFYVLKKGALEWQ